MPMTDEKDDTPRNKARPSGPRGEKGQGAPRGPREGAGKRSDGGPGGKKPYAAKGGAGRPFSKRPDGAAAASAGRPPVRRDDRPREAGAEGGDARPAKPYGAGPRKPYDKKPYAKKPYAKKPFTPRDDRPREAGAEGAEARPAKPYGAGPAKPYGAGPRKPYEKKAFDKKPFAKKPYEKKAFVPRDENATSEAGERPRFRREDRPREAGAEGADARPAKAYAAGPRKPYEKKPYDKKPYEKKSFRPRDDRPREAGAEGAEARPARNYGDGPRKTYDKKPFDKKPGDGKPFEKRPYGERTYEKKSFVEGGAAPRPGRRERDADAGQGGQAGEKPFRGEPGRDHKPYRKPVERSGAAFSKDGAGPRRPRAAAEAPAEPGERIAKRLARVGIASRRDAEELIAAGRVRVNGKVLSSPAFNVMPDDRIELDGTEIPPIERTRLFLFNKPAGVVTTNRDPEGRRTVFDVLPEGLPRLMTVGRLDINTEGLLLLTNDGGLARVLELPATGWLRRYRARVHGKVDEKALVELKDGVAVDGVFYGGVEASLDREQGTNAWLTIGLREGKNREVKNILGALGLDVTRLIRISYGPFQLGELEEGAIQELKGKMLRDQLGERLIEEAGANFEAPVAKPFSNKPVRAAERRDEPDERPKPAWTAKRVEVGEGGLIKNRKRDRERGREDALGRLTTRPERSFAAPGKEGRPPRKTGEREQRPLEAPGSRKANVWMAPGARPQGKASAAESAKPAGRKPTGAKPFGAPAKGGKPERPGDGPRGPRKGGSGADRRR